MYASSQRQPSSSSSQQGIFERAVQDPFGWSSDDAPESYGSSTSVSSMKKGKKSSPSPSRSNSIPTHLFGVERYVSGGLDDLDGRDGEPLGKERKKSVIEMSLARSFSRDE